MMVLSALPEARIWPSGLNTTDQTDFVCEAGPPGPRRTVGAALGLSSSHNRTVPDWLSSYWVVPLPTARVFPSGLKATVLTGPSGPRRTVGVALGFPNSQSRTVLSSLPEARSCPSGLKVT